MAGAPGGKRRQMGIWIDQMAHSEAERIASVAGLTKTQVIRLAIEAGLPIVAERFAPPPPKFDPLGGGE